MANWRSVAAYIHDNFKIADEKQGFIKLIFDLGDMRSQVVMVKHAQLMDGGEDWILIESPFGEISGIDVTAVARTFDGTVCGGLGVFADLLTVRHAVPLANLDVNEFERPLILVTTTADRLERKFVGGDTY